MEEDLTRKAVLALGGGVRLPEGFELPYRVSHSTAGPGAGSNAAVFAFGRYRVKKGISHKGGEFELVLKDGGYALTRRGEPFLDDVRLEPVVRHSPQQAFFNLDPRCMFHCVYCNSPRLDPKEDKHLSKERIMAMLAESMAEHDVGCVSFTSGVVGSIGGTVERMAEVVRAVRERYPDMPIGAEPYVGCEEHIRILREAGADEIKINLESPRKDIFERVCPDLDWDGIWDRLSEAVAAFGRGRVVSNIIYGMGETDEDMEQAMDRLCSMGVVPGIRALRMNPMNVEGMESAIGRQDAVSPERAVRLALMQKGCMLRHGFDDMPSVTMCMACGCCDLVPFRDF